jgi:hypothetical protein
LLTFSGANSWDFAILISSILTFVLWASFCNLWRSLKINEDLWRSLKYSSEFVCVTPSQSSSESCFGRGMLWTYRAWMVQCCQGCQVCFCEHHTLRITILLFKMVELQKVWKSPQLWSQSMSKNQSLDTALGFGRDVSFGHSFLTSRLPAEAEAVDWEAALKRSAKHKTYMFNYSVTTPQHMLVSCLMSYWW